MGTVGLSFGAATSGQGFDVASTVTQIQASEQAIETPWKSQLTALQAQDTVFTSLGIGSLDAHDESAGTYGLSRGFCGEAGVELEYRSAESYLCRCDCGGW